MNERIRASLYGVTAILIFMLVGSLLIALTVHFSSISTTTLRWTTFIISVLILMVGGFIAGKKTEEKGWITGLIVGAVYVLGVMLYQFLAQDTWMHDRQIAYFTIFILSSTIGSMLGVNTNSEK
ncbi:TIGR04086 family membrane protein [Bacillaceae bacterium W0354]